MAVALSISNATPRKLPGPKLLHHLPPRHAKSHVPAIHHTSDDASSTTLTYADLHDRSDALAHCIASAVTHSTANGKRFIVPLLIPQGPHLYISQLAILKAGGAFCPIALDAPEERLRFILADVHACLLLTTTAASSHHLPDMREGIQVIQVDQLLPQLPPAENIHRPVVPEDPAYVMYTSGSTGQPKGVLLSHSAATQALLAHHPHIPRFRRFLQFASPTFDVSVFEIFFPWLREATLVSCDRPRMLNDLAAVINDLGVDACELTPSVASSLLRRRESVPALKVLLTIGEMLKPSVVEEFGGDSAQRAILHGMYGPTEATIHCTLQTNFPKSLPCASIGIPLDTVSAFIVRPLEESGGQHVPIPDILPLGEEGELAVGGHQLADGYLNRDEQTKAAFVPHPQHGILYRTGDRARMLPDGTFECLGRISTGQVKLRGQRIELGEIEHVVFKTPGCHDVVAEVIGGILVAFCVSVDASLTASDIFQTCRAWLPAFMIPGDVVVLDSLPYLASGKCDRKALRAHYEMRQTSDKTNASTDVPLHLKEVLSAIEVVLSVSAQPNSSLPGLGLDSISSIRIASELKRQGLAQLDAGRLLAARTPLDICSLIQDMTDDARSESFRLQGNEHSYKAAVEKQLREVLSASDLSAVADVFPCTGTQTAMLAETSKNGQAYCNWVEFLLPDLQDCAALRHALHTLSEAHHLLRSGFVAVSGFSWSYINVVWSSLAVAQVKEVSHFDYNFRIESDADLLRPVRFQLVRDAKGCRLLLLAHHALYDQWAIDVFRRDLSAVLSGRPDINPTPFKAVSDYQVAFEKLDTASVTLDFWQEHLRDVATIVLPTLRGQHKEHGLMRTSWRQTTARTSEMRRKALALNCSTPAIFQASLALVLGAYTGTTDVVFGTVLSGRTIPVQGIDSVFGPCLATLPSRIDLGTTRTNADLLGEMTRSGRAMQDNMLVSTTAIRQAADLSPGTTLFDTLFVWQETAIDLPEVAETVTLTNSRDQLEFKLVLEFEPTSTDIRIRATYDQSLIDAHQADLIVDQVAHVALAVVDNPEHAVADISTLLPTSLLSIANPEPISYGNTFELTTVIDQRAKEHPEATAILFATDLEASPPVADSISYADLVARANRMARHFAAEGLQPQGIAVICMEKCIDLYVAMLASFKCGAGYLPLVPETPAARIKSILAQGNVHLCVCDAETAPGFRIIDNVRTVDLTTANLPDGSSSLQVEQAGSRISYAVFTSGSTGQPKGVAVTMGNLKGNLAVLSELYQVSPGDRLLQSCSQAFDVSVFEIFFAFYSGMCLCSATKEVMFRDFEQSIHRFRATHLSLTPTVATLANPSNVPSVKFLVTAGEGITEKVHKTWAGHGLHQGYGPSETTNICSINMNVSPTDVLGNIGPPFRNTSAFVIAPEHEFRILPAGAYGEFAFGGEQVFRGYVGRDDLNAEKIITHPTYGRIYRSGDMGRILSDGTLLISGRLDDQVKIRGNRVELGEINALLSNHSAVADCATILLGDKSSTQMLATFWVPATVRSDPAEPCALASSATDHTSILFGLLESSLPAYMIPSILVPLTRLPVTAQGKLDKRKLREIPGQLDSNIKNTLSRSQDTPDGDPPSTSIEQALASALSSLLEIDIFSISRSISFFSLGLNSLNAIQYAKAIETKLSTRLSVGSILRNPSVARLARMISGHHGVDSSVASVNVRGVFSEDAVKEIRKFYAEKHLKVEAVLPCTPLQEAMLSVGLAQYSSAYCNTTRVNVGGNMEKIKLCWHTLTSRHAILRTSFVETATAEHPFAQVVLQDPPVAWHSMERDASRSPANGYTDGLANGQAKDHNAQSLRPTQVSARDPIRIEEDGTMLYIQMHHALYDGISMANVLGEMRSLYQGHQLPPPLSFEPFLEQVLAQNNKNATDFWSTQISGFAAHPFPRISNSHVQREHTYNHTLALSPRELDLFSERHACTSLAVLQTAWTKTLACAQAVSDICFGNVVSGRSVPVQDVDRLVAPCFNTMPLRIRMDLYRTNLDLIRGLHDMNLKCLPFQLTAPRRIQALSATPSTPLFDSLLLLQPPQSDEHAWDIAEDDMDMGIPLVMEAAPCGDRFELQVHYLPAKVPDELVPVIADAFAASLVACTKYPSSSIDYLGEFNVAGLAAKLAAAHTSRVEHEASGPQDGHHVPWTDEERLIRDAFAGLARLDRSRITKHTSLYQIGLDSLNAVQIASRLRKEGLRVNAADVMQYATPSTLAEYLTTSHIDSQGQPSGVDLAAFEARHKRHLVRSLRLQNDQLEAIRPCTSVQSGMLAQFIQSQGSHYFNHSTFEVPDGVDVGQIRAAWAEVQNRHQVLRMGFAQLDNAEQPFAMLIYRPASCLETIFLDFEGVSAADLEEKATGEQVLQSLHLPAWRVSLSNSAAGRQMRVSLHHALYDADSLSILFSDFARALDGDELGPSLDLDASLKAQLEGSVQVKTKSEEFWKTALQSSHLVRFPNLTPTIVEKSRASSSEVKLTLNAEELDRFCRRQGVTIQALGQSIWALLLAAYFGEPDVTFGTVFAGATMSSSRQIAFPSISTLPVYCNTDKEPIAVIKDMVSYNASAQRYRFSSLSDIQRFAGSAGHALFDTIFVYQKTPDPDAPTFEWKPIRNELGIDYAISLELEHADGGKLRLRLTHETRTIPDSHASLILQQYNMLLRRIVRNEKAGGDCSAALMSTVSAKQPTIPCEVDLLHGFVERGARAHPDKVALEFIYDLGGTHKSKETWTYRDLDRRSNQIAHLICQRGIRLDSTIAVCMTKCPEAAFAFVGILKAGCAFLAMDPDLPLARRQFIAEDSRSQLLFVNQGQRKADNMERVVPIVELSEDMLPGYPESSPDIAPIHAQSTSYCLYTSGTTGNPKGCELSHENAVQAMVSFQRLFTDHWTDSSRWLQFASYWFDVSVLEHFWSWSVGITVVGAPRDVVLEDLPAFIRAAQITHIDLTPSLARLLKPEDVPSLHGHVFITGGEALKQEIIDAWGPLHTVYNGYGPTEATIGVTMNPHIGPDAKPSNIGPPFDNVGAYVFKPGTDEVVMRGAVGELCVSGKLVGKGYLNRPDLTVKAFPFLARYGEKVYRTGDLVRLLADDSVCFVGRQDTQAKLRGQRLEIGEIDAVIKQSTAGIADVASLVVKSDEGAREMLVSFLVLSDARSRDLDIVDLQPTGELVSTADRACRDHLPGYMVPTHIIPVTRIPLTVNNKVDTKRLISLFASLTTKDLQTLKGNTSADRNLRPAERKVAKILAQLLSIDADDVLPASNIYSLGLSSVSAINFTSLLKRSGFRNASVATVMNNQNVDRLATALTKDIDGSREEQSAVMQAQLSISAFAQRHRSTAAEAMDINVADIESLAPCTPLQEGLLIESLKTAQRPYFNHFLYQLHAVDVQKLEKAIKGTYQLLSILRTSFVDTDDGFIQVVLRKHRCPFKMVTIGNDDIGLYLSERRDEWSGRATQDVREPLQMLIVTGQQGQFLSIFIHHALYDGISWGLIMDRLADTYTGASEVDCGPDFHDAIAYGPLCRRKDAKMFWQMRMQDFHYSPLAILCDQPLEQDIHLRKALPFLEKLESVRKDIGVSQQAMLQAAFTVALHQVAPHTQSYGVVLSGRSVPLERAEQVIGPMFNTVPFAIDVQSTDTWDQYIQRCHKSNSACLAFQHTPLRDIRKHCGRDPADPMFDVLFVFQRPETSKSAAHELFQAVDTEVAAEYPLAFEVELDPSGNLCATVAARGGFATESTLLQLTDTFEKALTALSADADQAINDRFTVSRNSVSSTPTQGPDMTMLDGVIDFEWTKDALRLRGIIAQVVGCDEESIDEHMAIYTLGLDSIDAVKLASRMKRAGLAVPVSKLLQAQTIPRMLDELETKNDAASSSKPQSKLKILEQQLRGIWPVKSETIEKIVPAAPGQEALIADMVRSDFRDYYNSDILKLRTDLDLTKLTHAWQTVVDASSILRTSFLEIEDLDIDVTYAQVIHKPARVRLDFFEASSLQDLDRYIERVRLDVRKTFTTTPPLRLAIATVLEDRYLILSLAHAQYDGHSLALLHEDVNKAYEGSFRARPSCEEVIEMALDSTSDESTAFWRNALAGTKLTSFTNAKAAPGSTTYHAERASAVPAVDARKVCKQIGVSLQALAQSAWALLLAHYEHELEVTFGVVLACRESEEAEQVLFPTMNTVPIRASLHGTSRELLQHVQGTINEIRLFQRTPLRSIQAACATVVDSSKSNMNGLFDTLFVYQNRGDSAPTTQALYESVGGDANVGYPVAVEVEAVGDDVIIRTSCKAYALDQEATDALVKRFDHVLSHLVETPDEPTVQLTGDGVSICGLPAFPLQMASLSRQTTREAAIIDDSDEESDMESASTDAIRSALAQVSKLNVQEVSSTTSLESIGIDSISAIKVAAILRKESIKLSVSDILKAQTPKRMAVMVDVVPTSSQAKGASRDNTVSSALRGLDVGTLCRDTGIEERNVEAILSATAGQEYMLSMWQKSGGELFYPTFRYHVKTHHPKGRIHDAWQELLQCSPILRTAMVYQPDFEPSLLQVVLKTVSERPSKAGLRPMASLSITETAEGFDLALSIHHALYDAVSLQLLLGQLQDLANARVVPLPTVTFKEFVAASCNTDGQQSRQHFWQRYLAAFTPPQLSQPRDDATRKVQIFRPAAFDSGEKLERHARVKGVTVQALLFAVYAKAYASRARTPRDGSQDVVVGIYLANRTNLAELDQLAAPTLNLLPLRVRSPRKTALVEVAKQIDADIKKIGTAENSSASLKEIYEWTGVRVDTFVNFLRMPEHDSDTPANGTDETKFTQHHDDEWTSEIIRVVDPELPQDFQMPSGLDQFRAGEAYLDAVDLEVSISSDGKISIGLFAKEDMVSLKEGEEWVEEILEGLGSFHRE